MKCAKCESIDSIFNIGTIFRLTGGKYFIKTSFGIKIEILIFELSNVPNIKQFIEFLRLGPTFA